MVYSTTNDKGALDYDGVATISGGTVFAIGQAGMAEGFSTGSSQSYIMSNLSGNAGDTITITNAIGNILATLTAQTAFSNVVYSSETLTNGQSYSISTGNNTATTTATSESTQNAFGPRGMGFNPNGQPNMANGTTPPTLPDGTTSDMSNTEESTPQNNSQRQFSSHTFSLDVKQGLPLQPSSLNEEGVNLAASIGNQYTQQDNFSYAAPTMLQQTNTLDTTAETATQTDKTPSSRNLPDTEEQQKASLGLIGTVILSGLGIMGIRKKRQR